MNETPENSAAALAAAMEELAEELRRQVEWVELMVDGDEPRIRHLYHPRSCISNCGVATRPNASTGHRWNPGDQLCVICRHEWESEHRREWQPPCL